MAENKIFNPHEHLIKIGRGDQAKDYLPVQWRLVWFREQCPNGTIDTEEKEVDLDRMTEAEVMEWNPDKRRMEKVLKRAPGYARFRAVVTNGTGGRATGTKCEKAASFSDFVEKSETGSVGRALAALGYGTQFTDEEFAEGERLADAPVARGNQSQAQPTTRAGAGREERKPAQAAAKPETRGNQSQTQEAAADPVEKKRETVRKMAEKLGLKTPPLEKLDTAGLDDLISQYKQENAQRQANAKAEETARVEMEAAKK